MTEFKDFYRYLEDRPVSELKDCVHYLIELIALRYDQAKVDPTSTTINTHHENFRVQRIMKDITTSNIVLPCGMNGFNKTNRKFVRFLPGFGNLPVSEAIAKQRNLKPEWFIDKDLKVFLNWNPDGYFEMSRKDSLRFNQNAVENHRLLVEEPTFQSTPTHHPHTKKRRLESEGSHSIISIVSPPSSTKSSRVDEEAKQCVQDVLGGADITGTSTEKLPCLLVKGDHAFITQGPHAKQECTVIGHVGADPTKYTAETSDGSVIKVDAENLSLTSPTNSSLPIFAPTPSRLICTTPQTVLSNKNNATAARHLLDKEFQKHKQRDSRGDQMCEDLDGKQPDIKEGKSESDGDSWAEFFEWCFADGFEANQDNRDDGKESSAIRATGATNNSANPPPSSPSQPLPGGSTVSESKFNKKRRSRHQSLSLENILKIKKGEILKIGPQRTKLTMATEDPINHQHSSEDPQQHTKVADILTTAVVEEEKEEKEGEEKEKAPEPSVSIGAALLLRAALNKISNNLTTAPAARTGAPLTLTASGEVQSEGVENDECARSGTGTVSDGDITPPLNPDCKNQIYKSTCVPKSMDESTSTVHPTFSPINNGSTQKRTATGTSGDLLTPGGEHIALTVAALHPDQAHRHQQQQTQSKHEVKKSHSCCSDSVNENGSRGEGGGDSGNQSHKRARDWFRSTILDADDYDSYANNTTTATPTKVDSNSAKVKNASISESLQRNNGSQDSRPVSPMHSTTRPSSAVSISTVSPLLSSLPTLSSPVPNIPSTTTAISAIHTITSPTTHTSPSSTTTPSTTTPSTTTPSTRAASSYDGLNASMERTFCSRWD